MKNKTFKVLGLMSGTSMDGLDCCLCDLYIDNNYNFDYKIIDWNTFPYESSLIDQIKMNIANPLQINSLNDKMGKIFCDLVIDFLKGRKIDLIGSHGQTILHIDKKFTLQVGNPKYLHEKINVPIVYNFREKDIINGGNGAPLMPFLDWLLFKNSKIDTYTLNIGGISNLCKISYKINQHDVLGFDTGPGMALIDEFVKKIWNESIDYNGKYSTDGKIITKLENDLLLHPFIISKPPKSTGRNEFGTKMIEEILQKYSYLKSIDILRTLVSFTAKSIWINLKKYLKFSRRASVIYINGGGFHHPILMKDLKKYIKISMFEDLQNLGIHSDNKESLLIATLALSRYLNIPTNMKNVTGSKGDICLGNILIGGKLYE